VPGVPHAAPGGARGQLLPLLRQVPGAGAVRRVQLHDRAGVALLRHLRVAARAGGAQRAPGPGTALAV
ncbi:MAG: hypothetical protein AVDCRST_MAG68-651, partial [uncultured Gemmatimonadetes bacterium]